MPRCKDGSWCIDDLCYGTSRTLCGLEEGVDFGITDDFDDDYIDEDDFERAGTSADQDHEKGGTIEP